MAGKAKGDTIRKSKGQPCECSCGGTTQGGRFLPGHDARLKGRLLGEFDAGDDKAGERLVVHGWTSADALRGRRAKATEAAEAKAERERIAAERKEAGRATKAERIEKLRAQLAALEAQADQGRTGEVGHPASPSQGW